MIRGRLDRATMNFCLVATGDRCSFPHVIKHATDLISANLRQNNDADDNFWRNESRIEVQSALMRFFPAEIGCIGDAQSLDQSGDLLTCGLSRFTTRRCSAAVRLG